MQRPIGGNRERSDIHPVRGKKIFCVYRQRPSVGNRCGERRSRHRRQLSIRCRSVSVNFRIARINIARDIHIGHRSRAHHGFTAAFNFVGGCLAECRLRAQHGSQADGELDVARHIYSHSCSSLNGIARPMRCRFPLSDRAYRFISLVLRFFRHRWNHFAARVSGPVVYHTTTRHPERSRFSGVAKSLP